MQHIILFQKKQSSSLVDNCRLLTIVDLGVLSYSRCLFLVYYAKNVCNFKHEYLSRALELEIGSPNACGKETRYILSDISLEKCVTDLKQFQTF